MATASTSKNAAGGGIPSGHATKSKPFKAGPVLQKSLQKIYSGAFKKAPTASQFSTWLETTGSSPVPEDQIPTTDGVVTLDDFVKFLGSHHGSAVTPVDWSKKDMTRPLNEYFISSSHNTYLTGHQLYGESTTDGYIDVLKRGCRCIEIDVWDGDDGEPSVFHGFTLTKEISFKEVIQAIGKHAFRPEEGITGPVIISLECHAGPSQQRRCVEIMSKEWGDMLVVDPINATSVEEIKELPSPADLAGKILVKSKYREPPKEPSPNEIRTPAPVIDTSSSSSDSELAELAAKNSKQKPKKHKVILELSKLGVYCSAHHFVSFEHESSFVPNHCFSFSERSYLQHLKPSPLPAFQHNLKYLARIYPFGLRFSSTNTDPTYYWRLGAQILALNWQKIDDGMMLNEAMFSGEGGYVLKPKSYRPEYAPVGLPRAQTLDLDIEFIAAQDLPLPPGDKKKSGFEPYFKLLLHTDVVPSDEIKARVKKETRAKRGVEAEFNDTISFRGVKGVLAEDGSLGFLRVKIKDKEFGKDSLAGWFSVRLDRLKPGYGVFRVIDTEGKETDGIVLVRVSKKIY